MKQQVNEGNDVMIQGRNNIFSPAPFCKLKNNVVSRAKWS